MYKFEPSELMKELHKKYFERYVLPNFYHEIYSVIPNKESKKEPRETWYSRFHDEKKLFDCFMRNCSRHWEVLAVGEFDELEKFYSDNESLIEQIGNADKKTWNNLLSEIFGYEKFEKESEWNCIKQQLIEEYDKENKYNYRYSPAVGDAFLHEYDMLFHNNVTKELCIHKNLEWFKNTVADKMILCIKKADFERFASRFRIWTPYTFALLSEVRVCPYCNRQFISPVLTKDGKSRADIDHFLPKGIYPYFAMSLYNWIPSCKTCNSSLKLARKFDFIDLHPYRDNIGDYFYYSIKIKGDNESGTFVSADTIIEDEACQHHLNIFKLRELAEFHSDLVQSLVQRRLCYSEQYIEDLVQSDINLYHTKDEMKAGILGYVPNKKSINNTILGKMKYDIAVQLGFIDDEEDRKLLEKIRRLVYKEDAYG